MGSQAFAEKCEPATYDFSTVTIIGGGIKSINGDTTPAQILGALGPNLQITDLGGGAHIYAVKGVVDVRSTPPGTPQTVPAGVETVITACTIIGPTPGITVFLANVNSVTALPGNTVARLRMMNGAALMGKVCYQSAISANLSEIDFSMSGGTLNASGLETITLSMLQDSAGPIDFAATIYVISLGLP